MSTRIDKVSSPRMHQNLSNYLSTAISPAYVLKFAQIVQSVSGCRQNVAPACAAGHSEGIKARIDTREFFTCYNAQRWVQLTPQAKNGRGNAYLCSTASGIDHTFSFDTALPTHNCILCIIPSFMLLTLAKSGGCGEHVCLKGEERQSSRTWFQC
jgi:hypothetical protein